MRLQETPPFRLRCLIATALAAAGVAAAQPAWAQNVFTEPTPAERAAGVVPAKDLQLNTRLRPAGELETTAEPTWSLSALQELKTAQANEVLDLAQAWRLTVLNDPEYQAALSARASAETERRLGRAAILPQVQAGYSRSRITGDQTQYDFAGRSRTGELDYDSTSLYIQLQQPVFNVGRYAEFQRGHARAELGQAEFHEREQATALKLAEVYFEALRAESQWRLAQQLAESLERQAKAQERLYEEAEGDLIDAQETRSRLALARSEEIRSKDARDVALRELESMIGRPIGSLAGLSSDFEPERLEPGTVQAWMALARRENPAVKVAQENVRVAETELTRATGRHFPSVDLVVAYAKADSENLSSLSQRSNTWTAGLQANIPIFSGGYDTANRARAAAELQQARDDLRVAEEVAEAEAARQYTGVAGGADRVQALLTAVGSSEEGLKAAEASYQYGLRSNVDVLRSQDRLYEARSELIDARLQYLTAFAALHAVIGRLDEASIERLSAKHLIVTEVTIP